MPCIGGGASDDELGAEEQGVGLVRGGGRGRGRGRGVGVRGQGVCLECVVVDVT